MRNQLALVVAIILFTLSAGSAARADKWSRLMINGWRLGDQNGSKPAQELAEQASKLCVAVDESDPRVAATIRRLADIYFRQKRYNEAGGLYKRHIAIFEKISPRLSGLSYDYYFLGRCQFISGDFAHAEAFLTKACEIRKQNSHAGDPTTEKLIGYLGAIKAIEGRAAESRQLIQQACNLGAEDKRGTHEVAVVWAAFDIYLDYADSSWKNSEKVRAPAIQSINTLAQKAVSMERNKISSLEAAVLLCYLFTDLGQWNDAQRQCECVLTATDKHQLNPSPESLRIIEKQLATALINQNELADGLVYLQKLYKLIPQDESTLRERADVLATMAGVAQRLSEYKQAEDYYVQAAACCKKAGSNDLSALYLKSAKSVKPGNKRDG